MSQKLNLEVPGSYPGYNDDNDQNILMINMQK